MTKSQQAIIDHIQAVGGSLVRNVKVSSHVTSDLVFVTFNGMETGTFTETSYHIAIGSRGAVRFIGCRYMCLLSDKECQESFKTSASIMNYDLFNGKAKIKLL